MSRPFDGGREPQGWLSRVIVIFQLCCAEEIGMSRISLAGDSLRSRLNA